MRYPGSIPGVPALAGALDPAGDAEARAGAAPTGADTLAIGKFGAASGACTGGAADPHPSTQATPPTAVMTPNDQALRIALR
jgi:hypothetical protein